VEILAGTVKERFIAIRRGVAEGVDGVSGEDAMLAGGRCGRAPTFVEDVVSISMCCYNMICDMLLCSRNIACHPTSTTPRNVVYGRAGSGCGCCGC